MFILKKGHQPGVYVPLRALFLVFKVFINIYEYANGMIDISDHTKNDLCLSFNLVPSLVFYDK